MIELNKEYTYQQICELLNWKVTTGVSKMAQIKEIESSFKFYHPINKKTHKEKKSYVFTEQIKLPVKPTRTNSGRHQSPKNKTAISYMSEYILLSIDKNKIQWVDTPYTVATYLCGLLKLINKESYVVSYSDLDNIKDYCCKKNITDVKLFVEYTSILKNNAKNIFLKSIIGLSKKNILKYIDGYDFRCHTKNGEKTIQVSDMFSGKFNNIVKSYETNACNVLKSKYLEDSKLTGRQLLSPIYSNKQYYKEFRKLMLSYLRTDDSITKHLHIFFDNENTGNGNNSSDENNYVIDSYSRNIVITEVNNTSSVINDMPLSDLETFAIKITDTLIKNSRKELLSLYCINKLTGVEKCLYNLQDDSQNIIAIEKLLFTFYNDESNKKIVDFPDINFETQVK